MSKDSSIKLDPKVWQNNDRSIWIGSSLTLSRNIDKYNFPEKLKQTQKDHISKFLCTEIQNQSLLKQTKVYQAKDLSPNDKELLLEHFLTMESFHHCAAGNAFITEASSRILAQINHKEHLKLTILDPKNNLESSLNELIELDNELGKSVRYCFSSKFGFLTANPLRCGTGLFVTCFLHVPALVHTKQLDDALNSLKHHNVAITGLYGQPEELTCDLIALHNPCSLGMAEEKIISTLEAHAKRLEIAEKAARKKLLEDNEEALKDKISRAYALLRHSYRLPTIEALDALSLEKLGADLGWITGVEQHTLNSLLFSIRRAHLQQSHPDLTTEQLPHKRAELLHETLKPAKLHI